MIRRTKALDDFERDQLASEPADHARNLRIWQELCDLARKLGVLPSKDPLGGLEAKIRMARILNGLPPHPSGEGRPK
jgi:hypothetical protein